MWSFDLYVFFFFNDTATTEIYTLSLHDALPILLDRDQLSLVLGSHRHPHALRHRRRRTRPVPERLRRLVRRSEEHTSELQSRQYLVCRLLLEKKKTTAIHLHHTLLYHPFILPTH